MLSKIEIVGARTHNLKNIFCSFDHGALSVITGVSGSGKSSLAFDTLYAEGQRRYVESMSTYARQFLERMERPDIDSISGIQPAIALEQKNGVRSARSTVGTATEIHDFLRLLFAKIGRTICPDCKRAVRPETPESAMKTLQNLPEKTRLVVLGPSDISAENLTDSLRAELVRSGYHRLWDGTGVIDLEAGQSPRDPRAPLAILIDRLALSPAQHARLHSALQTAFVAGRGRATVLAPDLNEKFDFSSGMVCDGCGRAFPQLDSPHFSFYSPLGACPECQGFGRVMELDLEKVIPNPDLAVEESAIAPWNSAGNLEMYDHLRKTTTPKQIPRFKPIREFDAAQRANLIEGVGKFCGIRGFFKWFEGRKYKVQARVLLARYRAYRTCAVCGGMRLKPDALHVRFGGLNIAEMNRLTVRDLLGFFESFDLPAREREMSTRLLDGVLGRLRYLDQVGLDYLTLDRATRTLSGGESQRINLATSLGAGLTQTLYVLDEPTVGLHSRDTQRLISVLKSLRDLGNTVVVVEHDLEVIRSADNLMDLGPGAGQSGGNILFKGAPDELIAMNGKIETPTAKHIRAYHTAPMPTRNREPKGWLTIKGARGNNLKNLEARFPLGCFCCVTGVSGSGKTTLVRDTLTAAYRRRREIAPIEVAPYDTIEGLDQIKELTWVDQSPLSRSSRSNPATYVKAFDAIRDTLGASREARVVGLSPRHFSFNVDAGRCPTCQGTGVQTIDMHFMADIEVICETCDGKRFKNQVLALRWNGKDIDQILNMTAEEAGEFFASQDKIVRSLKPLRDVGLGYLRLGQNTTTLSGGEAQRLKLAGQLAKMREGTGLLFIFDEPTTGLHAADLVRLLDVFHRLVDRGCSLIVVEHNLDLIASADYILDLGPDGGDRGGEIVAQGSVKDFINSPASLTGQYLKSRFGS